MSTHLCKIKKNKKPHCYDPIIVMTQMLSSGVMTPDAAHPVFRGTRAVPLEPTAEQKAIKDLGRRNSKPDSKVKI